MDAQFAVSAAMTHGSSLGMIREQAIRDFLENHLPALVSVVSGQVFDADGTRSSQQDVVLVLKSVPRLPFASGIDLIYADGVVATVEVKSSLSGPVLKSAGEGIKSVRSLVPKIMGTAAIGVSHDWPSTRILSAVVAYGGSSLSTLQTVLETMTTETRPDLVLDLKQGLLVRNEGLLLNVQGSSQAYILINDPAEGFMMFLTFLTEITGTLAHRMVNWRGYWAP
ncbi:DUF6602 domain-containing protein [Brevundimonas sp. NPDC090276]|uniref:DUF6602 domain-containing protein n=1 Tax=Brevundimonas sp. NPDC090276 TaxID=3363956 RepID=UPI00383ADB10